MTTRPERDIRVDGHNVAIRRAKQRGLVDLSDALFTELEERGGYELVHRSGSF